MRLVGEGGVTVFGYFQSFLKKNVFVGFSVIVPVVGQLRFFF